MQDLKRRKNVIFKKCKTKVWAKKTKERTEILLIIVIEKQMI